MEPVEHSITNSVIAEALEYYDTNTEKYSKMLNSTKYISYEIPKSDLEFAMVTLYDKDKKVILHSRYEVLGIYHMNGNIWTWGWASQQAKKNMIKTSKELLNYGIDIDLTTDPGMASVKFELTSSRFKISTQTQIDIHIAMASFLSKNPVIFENIMPSNMVEFAGKKVNPLSHIRKIERKKTPKSLIYYLFLLDGDTTEQSTK